MDKLRLTAKPAVAGKFNEMDDTPVINEIKRRAKTTLRGQRGLADILHISRSHMSRIISREKAVTEEIAAKFGFERVWSKKRK
jgi:hypothetical protein